MFRSLCILAAVLFLTTPQSIRAQSYPIDGSLSPLSPEVVTRLRNITSRNRRARDRLIIKVGDSSTVNAGFMQCFAGQDIELSGRDHLAETIRFFRGYNRSSQAAEVGWSSVHVLRGGSDSPLSLELRDVRPRFALVMFGTNDIEGRRVHRFTHWMWQILDRIMERGAIPILSTIPPRNDDAEADALVPEWNLVIRGLAAGMRIPLIDPHRMMSQIPTNRGLAPDGYHPSTYWGAGPRGCIFTSDGLLHGQNVRNLLSIEMLHRLRETIVDGEDAPDQWSSSLPGLGTTENPFRIQGLPFTTIQRSTPEHSQLDGYGCADAREQDGPEQVFRFELTRRRRVTALVLGRARGINVDINLLGASLDPSDCRGQDNRRLSKVLEPGTYHVVVDSHLRDDRSTFGDYLLVLYDSDPTES